MKKLAPLMMAGALFAPLTATAGPADYVYTPTVEYGEKEIDFKMGSGRKGTDPRETAASIGFGYGATQQWFTEVYIKYKQANGDTTQYDALEWENKFQLTETGKYPIDVGFLFELERPKNRAEGWEVKWGPLLQTEIDKIQLNANFLLQRSYRAEETAPAIFIYQWQAKYRWLPQFEYGFQGFGEMGKWSSWARPEEQVRKLGPAIFGKLPLGNRQAIKYNAAWLFGKSEATPKHTLRMQFEYEF